MTVSCLQDCDGTVSFPPGVSPVMTFGPGCGYKYPANSAAGHPPSIKKEFLINE